MSCALRILRFEEKGKDVARRLGFALGEEAFAPGNETRRQRKNSSDELDRRFIPVNSIPS